MNGFATKQLFSWDCMSLWRRLDRKNDTATKTIVSLITYLILASISGHNTALGELQ